MVLLLLSLQLQYLSAKLIARSFQLLLHRFQLLFFGLERQDLAARVSVPLICLHFEL